MKTMTVLDLLPGAVHVTSARFVTPGVLRVSLASEAHARLASASLMQAGFDVARTGSTLTVVDPE